MEITTEMSLLDQNPSSLKYRNKFFTTMWQSLTTVVRANLRTSRFWLPVLFAGFIYLIMFSVLAIYSATGAGYFAFWSSSATGMIVTNFVALAGLATYILTVIMITLISPFLFKKESKKHSKLLERTSSKSYWALIIGKYLGMIAVIYLFAFLSAIMFYLVATTFSLGSNNLYYLSRALNILLGTMIVGVIWGVILTAVGVFFKHTWQATVFIMGLMFGMFLLGPIAAFLTLEPPTTQVVAVDKSSVDPETGKATDYEVTYVAAGEHADDGYYTPYSFIAWFDFYAATKSMYNLVDVQFASDEVTSSPTYTTDSLYGRTQMRVSVEDLYYNPVDYSEMYPNTLCESGVSGPCGTPANPAYEDIDDNGVITQYDKDNQVHSSFANNGWHTKSSASEHSQESEIIYPYGDPATGNNQTYLIDYKSYMFGEIIWDMYFEAYNNINNGSFYDESSQNEFLHQFWQLGWVTMMQWANTAYLDGSNIINTSYDVQSDDDLDGIDDSVDNDADNDGTNNITDPDDDGDGIVDSQDTVINYKTGYGIWTLQDPSEINNTNSYWLQSGQYESVGDIYLAYTSDSYNPSGIPQQEIYGSYGVSSFGLESGLYSEMSVGLYMSFYAFYGSMFDWADFSGQLTVVDSNNNGEIDSTDTVFSLNWAQNFMGLDAAIQLKIAEILGYKDNSLMGDWNYYKSMSMYLLENNSTLTNVDISSLNEELKDVPVFLGITGSDFYTILYGLSIVIDGGEDGDSTGDRLYINSTTQTLETGDMSLIYKAAGGLTTAVFNISDFTSSLIYTVTMPPSMRATVNNVMSELDGYSLLSSINIVLWQYNNISIDDNNPVSNDAETAWALTLGYIMLEGLNADYIDYDGLTNESDNTVSSDIYTIPATPIVHPLDAGSRITDISNGEMGVYNQTLYEASVDEYVEHWQYALIFGGIAILFFVISGFVIRQRNYY